MNVYVPGDRESSCEARLGKKRSCRLEGVDELVISLSARGLTHGR